MPSNYRGGPKRNDGKIAEKVRAFFINFLCDCSCDLQVVGIVGSVVVYFDTFSLCVVC